MEKLQKALDQRMLLNKAKYISKKKVGGKWVYKYPAEYYHKKGTAKKESIKKGTPKPKDDYSPPTETKSGSQEEVSVAQVKSLNKLGAKIIKKSGTFLIGEDKDGNHYKIQKDGNWKKTTSVDKPKEKKEEPNKTTKKASPEEIKQNIKRIMSTFGLGSDELDVRPDGSISGYYETRDRGPRMDHAGPEGEDWMDEEEERAARAPFVKKWKPRMDQMKEVFEKKGIKGMEVYLDYGEKGHIAIMLRRGKNK